MSEEKARPVKPRDAASVVLIRGTAEKAEVLMGRRRKRASFLPNIYVFPGGRVDASDRHAPRELAFHPHAEHLIRRHAPATAPLPLAIAALRETFEETGYLIARDAPAGALDGLPATPFWEAFRAENALPDLARMHYIARALTPTMSHKRFNTRFFMVDANEARGALIDEGELEDLHWIALDKAHRLPIVDVTEFVLNQARRRWADHAAGQRQESVPFLRYLGGRQRIEHG